MTGLATPESYDQTARHKPRWQLYFHSIGQWTTFDAFVEKSAPKNADAKGQYQPE